MVIHLICIKKIDINRRNIRVFHSYFKANECFRYCRSLCRVTFAPDYSLRAIGPKAFHCYWGLVSIVIPRSVAMIGASSFSSCLGLETASFEPDPPLASIDLHAFSSCALESIVIPKGISFVGSSGFSWRKALESIVFEEESELREVDAYAFFAKKLPEVVVPRRVELIRYFRFSLCK
jgi:hypothetical protein